MILRKIFMFLFVSSISAIILLSIASFTQKSSIGNPDNINLAIRHVAHNMYKILGQESTQIKPIKQISSNKFSFDINQLINYDTLPYLITEALDIYNIENDYLVTLSPCEEDLIILGFSKASVLRKEIPCRGREFDESCSSIFIEFQEMKANLTPLIIGLVFFSSIIGLLLLFNNRKAKKTILLPIDNPVDAVVVDEDLLHISQLKLNMNEQVILYNEETIELTFREAKLLEFLILRMNQVITREELLANVWGDEGVIVGRSLDVFISRLRKKIAVDEALSINSIHGVGYKLINKTS